MMKKILTICFALCSLMAKAQSGSFDDKAKAYVQQYAAWAIEEQKRVGIPASITLAQGIYETSAGESELATKANNHFGIKCKKEWRGETFAHTDDAPNECFRKYKSAKESYIDHSNYLKTSVRYAELFTYDVSNYIAWAKGLKKCGYATNPAYAQKLIKMVEDYELQQYTLAAKSNRVNEVIPENETVKENIAIKKVPLQEVAVTPVSITEAADKAQQAVMGTADDGTVSINGIRAIYCKKGDMLLDKAMKYNIRYAKLLEINELSDEPLARDMHIYLEPKKYKGAHPTYTVQEGETIELIAHNEGMSSRQLRIYNLMAQNEQAVAGSVLKLQEQADDRPATYKMVKVQVEAPVQNYRLKESASEPANSDFIPTKKSVQKVEEIEIGYGAERPANLPQSTPAAVVQEVQTETKTEAKETVKVIEEKAVEEVPQDEIALLKAKLDKAVYSRSSKSNMKVSSSDSSAVFANTPSISKPVMPAAAAKQAISGDAQYHIVEKGDTGYSIAKKYGIKVKQLNEWNNLNFDGIKIGQKLRVK
jgi:LysM repeat protein